MTALIAFFALLFALLGLTVHKAFFAVNIIWLIGSLVWLVWPRGARNGGRE